MERGLDFNRKHQCEVLMIKLIHKHASFQIIVMFLSAVWTLTLMAPIHW